MTTTSNVPNFDAMEPQEAWDWAISAEGKRPIAKARELFPERPEGYLGATILLRCYAYNIVTAKKCRKLGEIVAAMQYEKIAERIYSQLPEYARW